MDSRARVLPELALALLLVLPSWSRGLQAQRPMTRASEYDVRAVFLLNFTKFVEWPARFAAAHGPFHICILGEDPFGNGLDQLVEGETVGDRRMVVRRVREPQRACDLLYVAKNERGFSRILAEAGPAALTVGEGEQFLKAGGMIAFTVENRRVRFDIELKTAAAAGFRISSKLLNVARTVER